MPMAKNKSTKLITVDTEGGTVYDVLWLGEDTFGYIWLNEPDIHEKLHDFDSTFSYELDPDEDISDLIGEQPEFTDSPITEILNVTYVRYDISVSTSGTLGAFGGKPKEWWKNMDGLQVY